jgi:V/A-type H+-transporting ATPase subunit I
MQKVRIVGLHSEKPKVVRELHRLGVIDIRKSKLEMTDDKPDDALPEVSGLIVRYNSAKVILDNYMKKGGTKQAPKKEEQPKTAALIQLAQHFKAVDQIIALEEKQSNLAGEIQRMTSEKNTALLFIGSGIDFSKLKSEVLAFVAYTLSAKARKTAGKEIAELGKKYEVIENKTKTCYVLFVAYAKDDAAALEKLEHFPGVHKIDVSSPYFDSTAEKIVAELDQRKKDAEVERNAAVARLQKHAHDDYHKITSMLEMLNVEAERASASIGFKRTDSAFVIEGWVEKARIAEISAKLNALTAGKFELEEIKNDELAPTLVRRSKFLRPFDKIVEFFSLPRSDELNPTFIFILTFPIFYGMMVSDVGYGIASFAFAYLITKISDPDDILYNVAKLWQISSVAVIFFGFLSNQYFGFQLNQYFTSFAGFDWLKSSTTILAATIIFGIAQVILGLAFSFINNYHHGHRKIAVSKITSIIVIITGTVAISGGLFSVFNALTTQVATGILLISFLATIVLSGQEATEVVSLISHPLSYARIMGFGLASVILALLIDKAFTPSLSGGILGFAFTLIIFILLHFVNMILGTFEGLVQGVRLNFVEFFSKFYTGGGVSFKPFSFKRRYTKEV